MQFLHFGMLCIGLLAYWFLRLQRRSSLLHLSKVNQQHHRVEAWLMLIYYCFLLLISHKGHETWYRMNMFLESHTIQLGDAVMLLGLRFAPLSIILLILQGLFSLNLYLNLVDRFNSDTIKYQSSIFLSTILFWQTITLLSSNILQLLISWRFIWFCYANTINHTNPTKATLRSSILWRHINALGDIVMVLGLWQLYAHFGAFSFGEVSNMIKSSTIAYTSYGKSHLNNIGFMLLNCSCFIKLSAGVYQLVSDEESIEKKYYTTTLIISSIITLMYLYLNILPSSKEITYTTAIIAACSTLIIFIIKRTILQTSLRNHINHNPIALCKLGLATCIANILLSIAMNLYLLSILLLIPLHLHCMSLLSTLHNQKNTPLNPEQDHNECNQTKHQIIANVSQLLLAVYQSTNLLMLIQTNVQELRSWTPSILIITIITAHFGITILLTIINAAKLLHNIGQRPIEQRVGTYTTANILNAIPRTVQNIAMYIIKIVLNLFIRFAILLNINIMLHIIIPPITALRILLSSISRLLSLRQMRSKKSNHNLSKILLSIKQLSKKVELQICNLYNNQEINSLYKNVFIINAFSSIMVILHDTRASRWFQIHSSDHFLQKLLNITIHPFPIIITHLLLVILIIIKIYRIKSNISNQSPHPIQELV